MNKPYLLIVNYYYFPSGGTEDWKGCFRTFEEADSEGQKLVGKTSYYTVVDLRRYTE